jgi:hypothetical protein
MTMPMSTMSTMPGSYLPYSYNNNGFQANQPYQQNNGFCSGHNNGNAQNTQSQKYFCPFMNSGKKNDSDGNSAKSKKAKGKEGSHLKKMNCFADEMKDNDKKSNKSKLSKSSKKSKEGTEEKVTFECLSGCCPSKSGGGNGFTHGNTKFECDHNQTIGCGIDVGPMACNGACVYPGVPNMYQTSMNINLNPVYTVGNSSCYP